MDNDGLDAWRDSLKEFGVLWVGMSAPLNVLEQRENQRGNRMLGSARAQRAKYNQLSASYTLHFDTSQTTVEDAVRSIRKHFKNHQL